MSEDGLGFFPKYANAIKALPPNGPTAEDLQGWVLHDDPKFQVLYAPFDWVNAVARVVIVGITPGENSMNAAFRAARAALLDGRTLEDAARRAKRTGSFSNMRGLIAEMLDGLGLSEALGIPTTLSLFGGADADLVHTTSCVRYPVFYKRASKRNYSGQSPKLMRHPIFVRYIEDVLGVELQGLPKALIVPCGEAVSEALQHLAAKGVIAQDRCLFGFPHASGANGHRKRHFAERKAAMTEKVLSWSRSR